MLLRPSQPVEIFGNVSTPFGTLTILISDKAIFLVKKDVKLQPTNPLGHPLISAENFMEIVPRQSIRQGA